ncbi:PIN domain-containing protein [Pseudonocardia nigra]|uniref:PIN domain-containing protein n=1 Tax=Pseudonocardia nigra TaxID=1921578 RepID=UPI001C5F6969|nr:PIN domain-containing protein [Pseudonocardia nigra]
MTVLVLDTGALIALERRDRRMLAVADELYASRRTAFVPAGVVAQCWRGSPRQHAVMRLIRARAVRVDPLSEEVAYQLGSLLGASGAADVTDAHVAWLARRLRAKVVTSDPDDIRALDAGLDIVVV